MKTPWLVGAVVLGHAAIIGSVVVLQGCGTPQTGPVVQPAPPAMPPSRPAEAPRYEPPIATAPVRTPAPVQPIQTTPYTVVQGDTLSGIARRHKVSMAEIMALSGLRDADTIRVGQELILPGNINVSAPPPRSAPATPATPVVTDGATVHVVRSGDTLSHIAVRYNVTVAAIRQANNLQGDRILVDQRLKIPGASEPARSGAVSESAPQPKPARSLPRVEPTRPAEPEEPEEEISVDVDAPVEPAAIESTGYQTVEVGEGDNLRSIAMRHAVSLSELRKLNGLPENAEVVPGQTLRIPRFD